MRGEATYAWHVDTTDDLSHLEGLLKENTGETLELLEAVHHREVISILLLVLVERSRVH